MKATHTLFDLEDTRTSASENASQKAPVRENEIDVDASLGCEDHPPALADMHMHRRALEGAMQRWEAVEEFCAGHENLPQRFKPPKPERRICKHFATRAGCAFGDRCTHMHASPGTIVDVRSVPLQQNACEHLLKPRVCLHKLEDRKVGRGSISLLLRTLETGGFDPSPVLPEEADLLLANAFPPPPMMLKLRHGCVVNHFPGEYEIGAKDRLARLLQGLPVCPRTFVLPQDAGLLEQVTRASDTNRVWIVKPCQLGEGRHIQVLRGRLGLEAARIFTQRCVVSEYIENPLLIDGRKVDLRVYVLITSIKPHLKAFIFREGLARVCGELYDLSDEGLRCLAGHVSNNALQTKTSRHACALNWTLADLWAWMENSPSFASKCRPTVVWSRIRRTVRNLLEAWCPVGRAAADAAHVRCAAHATVRCYSLLAIDLLIDEYGFAWALEVNPKPALHAQNTSMKAVFPMHYQVKASLLADMFSLLGLPEHKGGPSDGTEYLHHDHLGFELLAPSARNPQLVLALMRNLQQLKTFLKFQCFAAFTVVSPSLVDAHRNRARYAAFDADVGETKILQSNIML